MGYVGGALCHGPRLAENQRQIQSEDLFYQLSILYCGCTAPIPFRKSSVRHCLQIVQKSFKLLQLNLQLINTRNCDIPFPISSNYQYNYYSAIELIIKREIAPFNQSEAKTSCHLSSIY